MSLIRMSWRVLWLGIALMIVSASAQSVADDPVVAPDSRESADNNVTFPVDI